LREQGQERVSRGLMVVRVRVQAQVSRGLIRMRVRVRVRVQVQGQGQGQGQVQVQADWPGDGLGRGPAWVLEQGQGQGRARESRRICRYLGWKGRSQRWGQSHRRSSTRIRNKCKHFGRRWSCKYPQYSGRPNQ